MKNKMNFSFGQMTSNNDGKTSGTGTAGLYIIFVGGLCFLIGCIAVLVDKNSDNIIMQSVLFTGIGSAMLSHRKAKSIGQEKTTPEDEKQ